MNWINNRQARVNTTAFVHNNGRLAITRHWLVNRQILKQTNHIWLPSGRVKYRWVLLLWGTGVSRNNQVPRDVLGGDVRASTSCRRSSSWTLYQKKKNPKTEQFRIIKSENTLGINPRHFICLLNHEITGKGWHLAMDRRISQLLLSH